MKHIVAFLLLISLAANAQTTKITYSVHIDTAAAGMGEQYRAEKIQQINKTLEGISFALIFDRTASKFYTYQVNSLNQAAVNEALEFILADRPIYNFRGEKYEHGAKGLADNDFLVKSTLPPITLHNDTLTINGFKCKKASLTYSNGLADVTDIAWYCPDVKGGFGPQGIAGCPGAVLMYQHSYFTYTAREVMPGLKYKVEFPSNLKVLSEDQYSDLWRRWEEKEMGVKN